MAYKAEIWDALEKIRVDAWNKSQQFAPSTNEHREAYAAYLVLTAARDHDGTLFSEFVKFTNNNPLVG